VSAGFAVGRACSESQLLALFFFLLKSDLFSRHLESPTELLHRRTATCFVRNVLCMILHLPVVNAARSGTAG
jgi:hypothetical protein